MGHATLMDMDIGGGGPAYGYADSDSEELAIFIFSLGGLRVLREVRNKKSGTVVNLQLLLLQ